jgi:hypothetical protein
VPVDNCSCDMEPVQVPIRAVLVPQDRRVH